MVPLPLIVIVVLIILVTTLKHKKEDFKCGIFDTTYTTQKVSNWWCNCAKNPKMKGHVCCQIERGDGKKTYYPSDKNDCSGLSCSDAENIFIQLDEYKKGCQNYEWAPTLQISLILNLNLIYYFSQ